MNAAIDTQTGQAQRTNKDSRPRRRYRLSEAGRLALRESAARNQPWRASTGPKSAEGKARASRNALKHGRRTLEYRIDRWFGWQLLRIEADRSGCWSPRHMRRRRAFAATVAERYDRLILLAGAWAMCREECGLPVEPPDPMGDWG